MNASPRADAVALVPLFSVVYMLVVKGGHKIEPGVVHERCRPRPFDEGGGFGNATAGHADDGGHRGADQRAHSASLAAVFLAEVGPETKLASVVRFGAKMLSGFPSILAGVFAYGAVVMLRGRPGGFSALAGGVALSLLMLPTVMLTAEEAIRMVPARIREAAIGMGATPTQVDLARDGAHGHARHFDRRDAGGGPRGGRNRSAAVYRLVQQLLADAARGIPPSMQPTASLAVLIYNFSGMPFENQKEMAWAAALVLVVLVLTTNLIGQSLSRRNVRLGASS